MNLSKYEEETVINYNAAESIASIYTRDKTVMRVLDGLVNSYPDVYCQTGQDEISKTYSVPKTYISYRKPRKLSDEQREQKRELMKRVNKGYNCSENNKFD